MATPDAPPAMPAAAATDVYCPHSPCSTIHKLGTPSFDDAKARMLREGYLTQDDLKDMELLDSLGIKTDNGQHTLMFKFPAKYQQCTSKKVSSVDPFHANARAIRRQLGRKRSSSGNTNSNSSSSSGGSCSVGHATNPAFISQLPPAKRVCSPYTPHTMADSKLPGTQPLTVAIGVTLPSVTRDLRMMALQDQNVKLMLPVAPKLKLAAAGGAGYCPLHGSTAGSGAAGSSELFSLAGGAADTSVITSDMDHDGGWDNGYCCRSSSSGCSSLQSGFEQLFADEEGGGEDGNFAASGLADTAVDVLLLVKLNPLEGWGVGVEDMLPVSG